MFCYDLFCFFLCLGANSIIEQTGVKAVVSTQVCLHGSCSGDGVMTGVGLSIAKHG